MPVNPAEGNRPSGGHDSARLPVLVPVMGSLQEPVRVSQWLVEVGEWVEVRERLVELVAAGITVDLVAPCSGIVREPLVLRGQVVLPGEVVGWVVCDNSPPATILSGSEEGQP